MNDKELAAVKLALEALEWHESVWAAYRYRSTKTSLEAIAALQSIISQDALDKKAKDARDLGLDYEPALMQQPATLDEMHAIGNGIMYGEQPAPVQGLPFGVGGGLVAIKTLLSRDPCVHANTAIEMIDAILKEHPAAQPAVQEGRDWSLLAATQESLREHMAEIKRLKAAQPVPVQHDECVVCGDKVRVIPRPWVGLTDAEVEAYDSWADFQVGCGRQTLFDMVRDIETKLKEKNT
jgi:hypothetical protein